METEESIRKQFRERVDYFYGMMEEYGVGEELFRGELARSDVSSWSFKGTVPPLIWNALSAPHQLKISDGTSRRRQAYFIILGSLSFLILTLFFLMYHAAVAIVVSYFLLVMVMAVLSIAFENADPWLKMKPPGKLDHIKSSKRCDNYYKHCITKHIGDRKGGLSIARGESTGMLTIADTSGGLEVVAGCKNHNRG